MLSENRGILLRALVVLREASGRNPPQRTSGFPGEILLKELVVWNPLEN
jgi:hypothetical protein